MKGQWKPYSNSINGKMMWIAGRRLEESVPLHSGNIETHGGYSEVKENVETMCRVLNRQETEDKEKAAQV